MTGPQGQVAAGVIVVLFGLPLRRLFIISRGVDSGLSISSLDVTIGHVHCVYNVIKRILLLHLYSVFTPVAIVKW